MIVIVDSGGANIQSIKFALQRLGHEATLTKDIDTIVNASHVILPGVGAAQDAMTRLQENNLVYILPQLSQPVLGICLGMQIMFDHSKEGEVDCLGIIPGKVEAMPVKPEVTIPHMGWNQINITKSSPILKNVPEDSFVYFVHSFAVPMDKYTIARCKHGIEFTAMAQMDNYFAIQFHPERSSEVGAQILKNFIEL